MKWNQYADGRNGEVPNMEPTRSGRRQNYVLCRRLGEAEAAAIVKDLVESDVVHVVSPPGVHAEAARCKCRNSIALADCYSISLARRLGIKAVFNRERELEEAMGRDPQLARLIVFLDQLQH